MRSVLPKMRRNRASDARCHALVVHGRYARRRLPSWNHGAHQPNMRSVQRRVRRESGAAQRGGRVRSMSSCWRHVQNFLNAQAQMSQTAYGSGVQVDVPRQ